MARNYNMGNRQLVPRLFTLPVLGDAASYLAETTTYLTSCFPPLSTRDSSTNEQELVTLSSEDEIVSFDGNEPSSRWMKGSSHALAELSTAAAGTSETGDSHWNSAASSSQEGGILAASASSGAGISLFKREHKALAKHVNWYSGEVYETSPLLVERARKTVRGSADDIGWLQKDPEMPPVEDGTERFLEILDSIRHGVHRLPNSMVYLLVPGLFSNHGALYFSDAKAYFSKMGLTCHMAKIHSEASVEKNARELKDYIDEIYLGTEKRVVLLGHSKGGIDAAASLSMYWPELKDKVAGLVLAQSPYGGSPVASDVLREGQLGDYINVRKLMEILICKVIKGDMQALEDLTYEKRREFLKRHRLPKELPIVSFHTVAKITPAVLATLSHVAHAELGGATKVPVVMPLGAVMGACAQLLQLRYGEKTDGLVTCRDAEVPGSVVVRPTSNMDHAWMVYSPLSDDPAEPNASQVCEALFQLLLEVGQRRTSMSFVQKPNDL